MKTLKEFIKETCVEFSKEFQIKSTAGFEVNEWLRTKLLQSATLTAEVMKIEKMRDNNAIGFSLAYNAALAEIENKSRAWFDTKR